MGGSETLGFKARLGAWIRRAAAAAVAVACAAVPAACGPAVPGLEASGYVPVYAHQAYGHSLAQSGLFDAALGRDWVTAAERALFEPGQAELPFSATGEFTAATVSAYGYRFDVASNRKLEITLRIESDSDLFVDLFALEPGRPPRRVASAPPRSAADGAVAIRSMTLDVLEGGAFVLRLQPELLRGGRFSLTIRAAPLLAFPVEGYGMRAIQSGFGAERDAGQRAHRGVDIFAARGTPVLAAADARVARVDTTPRGGRVVWLQPLFGDMRLYYAHLDTQRVVPGQLVLAGETVGTVGNTGNAATTPPHLHFGVYVRRRGFGGGARDPYPLLAAP